MDEHNSSPPITIQYSDSPDSNFNLPKTGSPDLVCAYPPLDLIWSISKAIKDKYRFTITVLHAADLGAFQIIRFIESFFTSS